jgi:cytochrome c oxidase assembly factor CtaG/putative copper export protein
MSSRVSGDVLGREGVAGGSSATGAAANPVRWLFAAPAVAMLSMLVALMAAGGAPEPVVTGLSDPGPVTAWGLPVVRLLFDAAAIAVIGSLVSAVLLPARDFTDSAAPALRATAWSAGVWAVLAALLLLLTVSDVLGNPPTEVFAAGVFSETAWQLAQGRGLLLVVAGAVVLAAYSCWTRTRVGVSLLLGLAVGALLPVLFAGHSSASSDHDLATSSLIVHVVGASVWVGGLAGVLLLLRHRPRTLAEVLPRYSMLALACFAAVALSGLLNAWVRTSGDLLLWAGSGYGALLAVKTLALVVLGCFGWWHRRRTIDVLVQGRRGAFVRLACVEVLVMAATVGVAVALSRTPPPAGATAAVPNHGLGHPTLGDNVQAFTALRLVTEWRPEAISLLVVAVMLGCYLGGVWQLRRAGESWPWARVAAATVAAMVALVATSGGLATYSTATFSAQVGQFLVLLVVVPVLITLSAPAALLQAVLRLRRPAGSGPAADPDSPLERLPAPLRSRVVTWLLDPLNMLIVTTVMVFALYATPLLEASLRSAPLHLAVNLVTLGVGTLLWWSLLGRDPLVDQPPRPYRLWVLAGMVVLLVGIAVRVYLSDVILAGAWFADLEWEWVELPQDQRFGALLMGGGMLVVAPLLAAMVRSRPVRPVGQD